MRPPQVARTAGEGGCAKVSFQYLLVNISFLFRITRYATWRKRNEPVWLDPKGIPE